MSEDLQGQRYYVLERISELREQIPQAMQAMVVFRARIEKYRQTDLSAAHDTYDALRRVRDDLTQALADAQPLLMELESYALATMAGQLLRGFKGFDLMSTGYRPVYDAVCRFTQQLPEKNTVNAATIGRLMNNVKLGYYPTDPDNIALMLQGISFPEGVTTNVFDPCCGCGKALRQIAQGNNCYAYGVELDESRAEEAQTRLHRVGFGSFFHIAALNDEMADLSARYSELASQQQTPAASDERILSLTQELTTRRLAVYMQNHRQRFPASRWEALLFYQHFHKTPRSGNTTGNAIRKEESSWNPTAWTPVIPPIQRPGTSPA